MVEKICKVINGEYCCDIDITIDEWKQLLTEPGHSATCGYIGKKYNEHSMSANGIIITIQSLE